MLPLGSDMALTSPTRTSTWGPRVSRRAPTGRGLGEHLPHPVLSAAAQALVLVALDQLFAHLRFAVAQIGQAGRPELQRRIVGSTRQDLLVRLSHDPFGVLWRRACPHLD